MIHPFEKGTIDVLADDAGPSGGATIVASSRGTRALYWFVRTVWPVMNFLANTKEKVVFESDSDFNKPPPKKWWEMIDAK